MPVDNGPLKPINYLILLLLAEEPTYGVELIQRIADRSQGSIKLNAGSLYRTIAGLVEDGLVEPLRAELPEEGSGAPRKLYQVTARGRTALLDEASRQQVLLDSVRALNLSGEA